MNVTTPTEPTAYQLKNLYIYLQGGLTLRLAANSIGVTEATVRTWMQQNPEIEIRVGAAEAYFQLRCLDAIMAARDRKGNLNVRAVMFLLQARFPEQFAPKTTPKSPKKPAAAPSAPSQNINENSATETAPPPPISADIVKTTASATDPSPAQVPVATPNPKLTIVPKPGRNTPCPCQSGHKYKHCCGATSDRTRRTGLKTTILETPLAA
jgi:hypothetical protein